MLVIWIIWHGVVPPAARGLLPIGHDRERRSVCPGLILHPRLDRHFAVGERFVQCRTMLIWEFSVDRHGVTRLQPHQVHDVGKKVEALYRSTS